MNQKYSEGDLRRLLDAEEIRTLRSKYTYGVNIVNGEAGDLKAFASLFAPDAIFSFGTRVAKGPAEIEQAIRELAPRWQCAMHYMLNPIIEIDGDNASGTFTGLIAVVSRENPCPMFVFITYADTYVRTGAGWRFKSVDVKTHFAPPEFAAAYAKELAR